MAKEQGTKPIAQNKKARHDYAIEDKYEAGLVLTGTEVKSLRLGHANINDAFGVEKNGELYISNMFIAEYANKGYESHAEKRDRKLLLNRRELDKLQRAGQDKGLTIVGLRMFLNERGLVKIVIGLARGRKTYDKREYLKENDAKREIDKAMKNYRR